MKKNQNTIGERGEFIFNSRITQYGIFSAYFFGEKAPIVDFLLQINDENTPFSCLIQIKSTEQGYNSQKKLKVNVPQKKFEALIKRPLPTYIAGVDLNKEIVFITPAFSLNDRQSSMKTNNKLDYNDPKITQNTLNELKSDIINYWNKMKVINIKSSFKSQL